MIIGLAGKKGSGKNTIANIIEREFSNNYLICQWAFATDLKISAMKALGWKDFTYVLKDADELKKKGSIRVKVNKARGEISGREYLQYFGDAHKEVFGADFWVDNLITKIRKARWEWDFYDCLDIITDVRFPNEAEAIHAYHGVVINIVNPLGEIELDNHPSEHGLPSRHIDIELLNDRSVVALAPIVKDMIKDILEWRK